MLAAVAALAMVAGSGGAEAQGRGAAKTASRGPDAPSMIVLRQGDGAVEFQQVRWELSLVELGDSNWGQVVVDPDALTRRTGWGQVYVNVFLYRPGTAGAFWAADNILATAPGCEAGAGTELTRADRRSAHFRRPPISRYLNISPERDRDFRRVANVEATVVATAQPLPVGEDIQRAVEQLESSRFPVKTVVENTDGWFHEDPPRIPPRGFHPDALGSPPGPLAAGILDVESLGFPTCVFQSPAPNVECALNQCVPMATANALQYLEDNYDGDVLSWELPHSHVPGVGVHHDLPGFDFWEPVPPTSLVAVIDGLTRRDGVLDDQTGGGANICMEFRGLFGYLAGITGHSMVETVHQGSQYGVAGAFVACDNGDFSLGSYLSFRVAAHPTWEWIYEQLNLGRAVTICFGRYDPDGHRTSGHAVRVYGACEWNGLRFIYTLDDGDQGAPGGLRTQAWQVADTGSPGAPGVPDGNLNLNGSTWEIEFAKSIRAKPYVDFP